MSPRPTTTVNWHLVVTAAADSPRRDGCGNWEDWEVLRFKELLATQPVSPIIIEMIQDAFAETFVHPEDKARLAEILEGIQKDERPNLAPGEIEELKKCPPLSGLLLQLDLDISRDLKDTGGLAGVEFDRLREQMRAFGLSVAAVPRSLSPEQQKSLKHFGPDGLARLLEPGPDETKRTYANFEGKRALQLDHPVESYPAKVQKYLAAMQQLDFDFDLRDGFLVELRAHEMKALLKFIEPEHLEGFVLRILREPKLKFGIQLQAALLLAEALGKANASKESIQAVLARFREHHEVVVPVVRTWSNVMDRIGSHVENRPPAVLHPTYSESRSQSDLEWFPTSLHLCARPWLRGIRGVGDVGNWVAEDKSRKHVVQTICREYDRAANLLDDLIFARSDRAAIEQLAADLAKEAQKLRATQSGADPFQVRVRQECRRLEAVAVGLSAWVGSGQTTAALSQRPELVPEVAVMLRAFSKSLTAAKKKLHLPGLVLAGSRVFKVPYRLYERRPSHIANAERDIELRYLQNTPRFAPLVDQIHRDKAKLRGIMVQLRKADWAKEELQQQLDEILAHAHDILEPSQSKRRGNVPAILKSWMVSEALILRGAATAMSVANNISMNPLTIANQIKQRAPELQEALQDMKAACQSDPQNVEVACMRGRVVLAALVFEDVVDYAVKDLSKIVRWLGISVLGDLSTKEGILELLEVTDLRAEAMAAIESLRQFPDDSRALRVQWELMRALPPPLLEGFEKQKAQTLNRARNLNPRFNATANAVDTVDIFHWFY
ncbi:hypothetical protein ACFL6C_07130 [Myxococcota bacterium]